MKWCTKTFASLSLAGLALASSSRFDNDAEVFILSAKHDASSTRPRLPPQLVRHILLQRVSTGDDHSSLSADLPDEIETDRALAYLNQYGREPRALFSAGKDDDRNPSMVLMLEGITEDNGRALRQGLKARKQALAFTVADTPSADATAELLQRDFSGLLSSCNEVADLVTPENDKCWSGRSLVAKHDVAKNPEFLSSLTSNLDTLLAATSKSHMEVMLLLVPESSRTAGLKEWTSATNHLDRRQAEAVITDHRANGHSAKATGHKKQAVSSSSASTAALRKIPNCFASASACMNATDSCSGHGACHDRFSADDSKPETSADGKTLVCFQCVCAPTINNDDKGGQSRTFWGGNTCAKQDVSTQFWLIAGMTVALIGLVSLSVGMLFSVGEEKLPGVIGAGVSKSSK
ncbi:hypothetical protein PpBr36_00020 [Pyricularia pennisetigena]|uniref:hypothetical protein n=1 Tax=Pyricularia pennisetigena TaxID=1578925 RepID=UPI00114DBF75|nr:hypothetical protein PpBr36_00020 [Pyricularia pennisetigena]TLS29250.1 hypothetical protein PpBr36_00020 [Pyricularia pennisetigena]